MNLRHAAALALVGYLALAATRPVVEPESQAALLFRVDHKRDFSFSAKLTLPPVAANKGQYSIWILVGELKGSFELPALVQGGLLSWNPHNFGKPSNFVLQPFVGAEKSGGIMQTILSPPLAEDSAKEHEFRIRRTGNDLGVYMDSMKIFTAQWSAYFRDDEHIYLRIASEVLVGGDTVSGTVRDIELTDPAGKVKPYLPAIADEDRGAVFVCQDHVFVATGTFDSKKLTEPRWFAPPPCEDK
jgi:hypothetical protein